MKCALGLPVWSEDMKKAMRYRLLALRSGLSELRIKPSLSRRSNHSYAGLPSGLTTAAYTMESAVGTAPGRAVPGSVTGLETERCRRCGDE